MAAVVVATAFVVVFVVVVVVVVVVSNGRAPMPWTDGGCSWLVQKGVGCGGIGGGGGSTVGRGGRVDGFWLWSVILSHTLVCLVLASNSAPCPYEYGS